MFNSKLIKYTLVLAFFAVSCDEMLDLNPNQSISDEQALTSAANLRTALIGAYDLLSNNNIGGGEWGVVSDIYGNPGDIVFQGTFTTLREIDRKQITVANGQVSEMWLEAYEMIAQANLVINAFPNVDGADPSIIAEARFLRAVGHFETVRFFAKAYNDGDPNTNPGIPLVLTVIDDPLSDEAKLPRATVQQVYDQVIEDLEFARDNLGDATILPVSDPAYAANTYVASAYLARVYLQMGDYANAAAQAERVVTSGNYALTTLGDLWPATDVTTEDIFSMPVNAQDGANSFSTFYSFFGRNDILFSAQHFNRYEAGDERALLNTAFDETTKWDDVIEGDVKTIRLAEMLLIHAESVLRTATTNADSTAALGSLNAVRTRAALPALTLPITVQNVIDERYVELAFEGQYYHDAKRLQLPIAGAGGAGTIAWNDDATTFPIPQREREVNQNLTQNPGYSEN